MGEFDSGTAARWRLGYRDLEGQSALLAATGQALVVQVPGAGGSWQARSSLAPGAGLLGVRSLRSAGRVVFPAGASLESVELEPLGFECTMAEHSRLGDLQDPAGSIDESDFVVDDTLEIAYQVAAEAQSGEDCFFKVSIPGASQPSAAAPRVRAPAAPDLPVEFALEAPWPNPFSGATSIRFDLPRASTVKVEVFDVQGRKVTVLAGQALPAGRHSVQWSGRNERGERAAAGVYLCRLTAGSFVAERRMTLLP
ncbi:MAG: FlgD immunoglobulin-like domain containing protein [Candidatus Eisenbacteria bacterium]